MTHLYVDESIHERGGFIVAAAVYSQEPLEDAVATALTESGFVPGRDEFKSSMTMAGNESARRLREQVQTILWERCKVGLVVCPTAERGRLMEHTFALLGKLVADPPIAPGTLYFDEGIRYAAGDPPAGWQVFRDCDSRKVGGIQVADCAAHTLSIVLLRDLGIANKIVRTEEGYPEPEVELAWMLWSWVRDAMASNIPAVEINEDGWREPWMEPFGIHVSDGCSDKLKSAIERWLLGIWLGCIH